jgi:hypothetical protein
MSISLVALALAVAVSPSAMLAVVVMMAVTARTRTSWTFVAGWFLSIGVTAAVVMVLGRSAPSSVEHPKGDFLAFVDIGLGIALAVLALRTWRRARSTPDAPLPGWIDRAGNMAIIPAFALGAFLPPAVIAMAAGNELAQRDISWTAKWVAVVVFSFIGALGGIIPVAAVAIQPSRSAQRLARWQSALEARWRELLVVIFAVIAGFLVVKGVVALAH